jgi:hypothetical protein
MPPVASATPRAPRGGSASGLTPRQLARQLRESPAVAPPPKSFDVVYKRSTQEEPGTHLMFGNSGGRVKTPGGTVRAQSSRPWTPNSTVHGQSGLQHAHQWEHVTARERGPRVGHFLGRTREHDLAVRDWAQQGGEVPAAPLGSSVTLSTVHSPSRANRKTFSPRTFRQGFARREGRAVEDETYFQARRQARVLLHSEELAAREQGWSKCRPWVEAQKKPAKPEWEKKLERGRREMKKIEQKRNEERAKYEKKTRKLLKDCGFLLERMADHDQMHTMDAKAQLAAHAGFINRTNITLRNGEMTCKAKFEQVETFHRIILVSIFELMDEDGGGVLDRDEIRSLARAMGVKLTDGELKDAMQEMDEDGSGEVDFEEFYQWWTVGREAAGGVMAASLSDDKPNAPFEITPLEYM